MGQKVSPISFRLGKIEDWQSKWFVKKGYRDLLKEDLALRKVIFEKLSQCLISKVEIKREKNLIEIDIYTARPGMIIGRSGTGLNSLKELLSQISKNELKINILEVKEPDKDASLVAQNIARQIEKRISYKRAIKRAIDKAILSGVKGIKITVSGRLAGVEIARRESSSWGTLPLSTISSPIDFGKGEAKTTYGTIGVKVWINRG